MQAPDYSVDVLCNLSYLYIAHRKVKRALDYLDIASAVDGDNLQVKKLKAMAFYDAKEFDHALNALDEVDAVPLKEQDRLASLLLRSYCLNANGQPEKAKSLFDLYLTERKKLAIKEHRQLDDNEVHEANFEFSEKIRNMKGDKI